MAVYPHGDIEKITDGVFMVRGSINLNPLVRITRNMAIVREGTELTIINPLRLNDAGERSLEALGKVRNIMRLGAFHGVDDPYYKDRFDAKLWAQAGGKTYPQPDIDVVLGASTALPFDATLFDFEGTTEPECALLFPDSKLLLTCDAIQHYGDYSYNNWLARRLLPFVGFPMTTIVGPIWLQRMVPEGDDIEPVFRQLLELDFDSLLSAHGTLLESGAKEAVAAAIDRAFSR